jgi:hypothetical protein
MSDFPRKIIDQPRISRHRLILIEKVYTKADAVAGLFKSETIASCHNHQKAELLESEGVSGFIPTLRSGLYQIDQNNT